MQKQLSKALALVLSLAIIFGYMPAMPVYADGGIADKYTIEAVNKGAWGDDIDVEIANDAFTDGDFAEVTKVVINGDTYTDKSQMRNFYGDFRISGADVVASYQKTTPVSMAIFFSDDSVLKTDNYDDAATGNTGGQGNSGNNNNNGANGNNSNIADKYTIEAVDKGAWGDDIDVEIVNDAFTDGDFAEVTKVVINGDTYTDKSQMRNYYGDFRISGADVVASYQKTTPVSMAIFFSDDSVLKTDNYDDAATGNTGGQGNNGNTGDQGTGTGTETANTEFVIKKVDVKADWSGKEFLFVVFENEFKANNVDSVKKVLINGEEYTGGVTNSYYSDGGDYSYHGSLKCEDDSAVTLADSQSPVTVKVVWQDDTVSVFPADGTGNTGDQGNNGNGNGNSGNQPSGEVTVSADGTVLTFADGSTLSISNVSKDQTMVTLSFTYTPKDNTSKTFTERLEAIEAITIDNYEAALKDAYGYSTYFASEENQTVSWFKPSERHYNETAWDLVENYDKYQSHGATVTFANNKSITFGTPELKDNALSQTYQIENVTVVDPGDGKKVTISFADNKLMTTEDFELISQILIDNNTFSRDKFLRVMGGRSLQSSDSAVVTALDNDAEHTVKIEFVGNNAALSYTVPAKNNGGGDQNVVETDTITFSDPHEIRVRVEGVQAITQGTQENHGKAVTVLLKINLGKKIDGATEAEKNQYIWKYCGTPSASSDSKLVSIKIDERNIPFKDSNGVTSFVFSDSAYTFNEYGQNDVAAELVADFAKRDKHRVEVEYTDGTIVYQDEGYVKRTDLGNGNNNTTPPNNNTGLAGKYVIKEMKPNWNDTAFDIDFTEQMTADDFAHLVSVKVNGEVISKDKFILKSWGSIRTEDATAIALLEAAQKENVELIFDDASGGNTPGDQKIADKYAIEKITEQYGAFSVDMVQNLEQADVDGIKQIFINGETFDNSTFFIKYGDELRSEDAAVLAAFNKETADPVVAITFADDSVLATANYVPGGGSGDTLTVSEVKKVVLDTTTGTGDKEVIVIVFDKDFTDDDLAKLVSVEVNGQVFTDTLGRSYSRAKSDSLKTVLYLDNAAAMTAFNDTTSGKLNVSVNFKDVAPMTYQKDVFTDADKYGFEGFAEDKSIEMLSIYEHFYTKKQMLSIKLDTSVLSADADKVKSVTISGETFDNLSVTVTGNNKQKFSVYSDALAAKLTAIQAAGEDIDQLPFILTFTDNSQLAKNAKLVDNNKIDLSADLADGEYTLSFRAYKVGTDELSMMQGYFDKRVKLVVENGQKTISLALVVFAEDAVDLALEQNNALVSMPSQKMADGKVVVFSSPVDSLTDRIEMGALVNAGPFSASEGDIGNWNKYAKAEIEFKRLTNGFAEFKFEEAARIEKAKNLENLTEALIANGVDTNSDGVISTEELGNAKGSFSEIYTGEKKNNVLDLDGYHISDISMLKDLGPGVRHLLLRNNDIETIPANAFANATGLESVLLSNNNLKTIDADAFKGLANLELLTATTNANLTALPQGLLAGNDKLAEIYFNGCAIETVGSDLLKGKPDLTTLFLQENNIKVLADDFFEDQNGYELVDVNLANNQLESLPSSLGNAKNLNKLIVYHNKLKALPNSFVKLNKLQQSDFSHNQITEVPTEFLVNLSKLAQAQKYSVMVDFSDNFIEQLDLDALLAVQSKGNGFRKFSFELNNLWANLSAVDKEKLTKLGVDFEGYGRKFLPQKQNAELKAEGVAGNIELSQTFGVAELYLWDDLNQFGDFMDSADFAKYLAKQYKILNKPTREANLEALLKNSNIDWKIQTIITKNDGEKVYDSVAAANTIETLEQQFDDGAMKNGETYVVAKVLYVKSIFGEWEPKVTNKTSFVARNSGDIQDGETQEIGVKALKTGKDEPSMMGQSINPVAKLALENGQYTYTLQTDMQIADFKLMYKGQPLTLATKQVTGQYPLEYSFSVNEKIMDRVNASFKVIIMNRNQTCDLVFDYDKAPAKPGQQDNRIVDAYILKTDKSALSMANESLDNNKVALSQKNAQTYSLKFKFNPMTIGKFTAGVTQLFVQVNGQYVEATALADGKFVVEIPATMVKPKTEASETEVAIKFAMDLSVPGHDKPVDALLLVDWNGDYQPPKPNDDTTKPGDGTTKPGDTTTPGGSKTRPDDDDDDDSDDDRDSVTIQSNRVPLGSASTIAKVVADQIAVTGNVRVVGDKATVNVDQKSLTAAVEGLYQRAAKARQVVVKAAVDEKVNQVETVLTKAVIADMAAKAGASLKIDNQTTSVVLSQNSLQNIAKAMGQKVVVNTTKGADGALTLNITVDGKALTNVANGITVEMTNANNKAGQVVVLVAADGSQTVIKKSFVSGGKAYAELPSNATIKVVNNSKVFDDVSTTTPLYNAIAFASSHELFKGTSANQFSPNGEMTRAMLVTVLHRLENAPSANKNYFADVAQGDYYFDAVAWASEKQIVEGYNGNFSPDNKITREQIITILYRYVNKQHKADSKPADMSQFSDSAAISDWAKEAMQWAVSNDILPKGTNKLNPQANVTRAEVAYFMQKIVELQLTSK